MPLWCTRRSNLHRVLPPPGAQRACARWSGIFFLVPEYGTPVRPLEDASEAIRQAAKGMKNRPAEGTTCALLPCLGLLTRNDHRNATLILIDPFLSQVQDVV